MTKDQLPGHAFPGLPECCGPVCPCVNDGESMGLPNSNSSQAETHGCLGVVRTAHPASGAGVLKVLPGQRGRSGLGVCRVEVLCQFSPCLYFHKGSRWFGKIQFKRTEIELALQGSNGQDFVWGQLHYLLRTHQASRRSPGGWGEHPWVT